MLNLTAEIRRLNALTVPQLREEFQRLWGEPSRSSNRVFLIKRIVWRMQSAAEGGLSDRALRRAEELARDQDLRVRPRPEVHAAFQQAQRKGKGLPPPGTVLSREYRGRRIEVEVLDLGFRFDGREYRSLSAIAKSITGAEWNGRLFFGLTKPGGRS